MSEEEWPGMDEPEFEQDDLYLEYSVPYDQSKQQQDNQMSTFDEQHEYSHFPDHNLISDVNVGKAANMMEYRHCDSDCAFCGMCSSRFADRLTERLLMHML
jgi:hypothetical protein